MDIEMGTPLQVLFPAPGLGPCRTHRTKCTSKARWPARLPRGLHGTLPHLLTWTHTRERARGWGGLPEIFHSRQSEVERKVSRENKGLIGPRGVGLSRAGPQIPSYFPTRTPQPPPGQLAPQTGASSHAQRSWPSRPIEDHASIPKWVEAAGRGGLQPGSPLWSTRPRPAPSDPGPEPEAAAPGPSSLRSSARAVPAPQSPARPAAARQVGGAAQREACASARVFMCVFQDVCAGATWASACPVSIDQCVWGVHIQQAGEEGSECWPSASGDRAWSIRQGPRGSSPPNPHPAARGLPDPLYSTRL